MAYPLPKGAEYLMMTIAVTCSSHWCAVEENWNLECSLPQYLHVAHGARAELCQGVKWRCVQVKLCAQLRLMRVCELQSWLCTCCVPLTGRGLLPLHILSCTAWRDCRTAASSAVRSSSTLYCVAIYVWAIPNVTGCAIWIYTFGVTPTAAALYCRPG
jgi:hypothetical protein